MVKKSGAVDERAAAAGSLTARQRSEGFVAEYLKSDVAHKTSRVFADATRGSVRLRVQSGQNFVLLTEDAFDEGRRRHTEIAHVLPLLRAPVEQFPSYADYAWTASLSLADRETFRDALWLGVRTGFETGSWDGFDRTLDRWYDTAMILADPELTADLKSRWDRGEEVPLERP